MAPAFAVLRLLGQFARLVDICSDTRGLLKHGLAYWRLKRRYLRWQEAKGS